MKVTTTILLVTVVLMLISAAALQAQPTIQDNGVVNASSELPDIARGAWFVVKGSGMGPASIVVQNGPPYPATLAGTSITFTPAAGGTPVSALMYYSLAAKVAGMLPSGTPAGDYDVKVTYNTQTSAAQRVKVVERNFGFATQSSNGKGPAQATYGGLDLNRFTTGTLAGWSLRPAKAGDTMVLWGTGLGADPASDATGASSGDQTADAAVRVIVGGTEVTPAYAGRSPNSPGLDQINFTIPAGLASNCFVSLQVRAGGRLSNLGSIAVVDAGQTGCSHPTLSPAQLSTLDQGGSLVTGGFYLLKSTTKLAVAGIGSFDQKTETASGSFSKLTVDTVGSADVSLSQSGTCSVLSRMGTQDQIIQGVSATSMDAGAQLSLNGPNATNLAVPRQTDNSYNLSLYSSGINGIGAKGTPTFSQGTYTLAGTGGTDIGAFSTSTTVPADLTWTNRDTIADPIPRGSNLLVNWTGGGSGLVTIIGMGFAKAGGTADAPIYNGVGFTCIAAASAGTFTVPPSVLAQVPTVSGDITSGQFGTLAIFAFADYSKGQGAFSAPVLAGGTAQAFFGYRVGAMKTTGWQ